MQGGQSFTVNIVAVKPKSVDRHPTRTHSRHPGSAFEPGSILTLNRPPQLKMGLGSKALPG